MPGTFLSIVCRENIEFLVIQRTSECLTVSRRVGISLEIGFREVLNNPYLMKSPETNILTLILRGLHIVYI